MSRNMNPMYFYLQLNNIMFCKPKNHEIFIETAIFFSSLDTKFPYCAIKQFTKNFPIILKNFAVSRI